MQDTGGRKAHWPRLSNFGGPGICYKWVWVAHYVGENDFLSSGLSGTRRGQSQRDIYLCREGSLVGAMGVPWRAERDLDTAFFIRVLGLPQQPSEVDGGGWSPRDTLQKDRWT